MQPQPYAQLAIACALHGVAIGAGYMSVPVLFARMELEGWSIGDLQRAWALVPLGSAPAALITGALLQRWPARRVQHVATLLTVASLIARAGVRGETGFALLLLAYGVGTGALLVVLTDQVGRLFARERVGFAQGMFFGAYAVGAAVGIVTADAVADVSGDWRAVSLLWGILTLLIAAVSLVLTSERRGSGSVIGASAARRPLAQVWHPVLHRYAAAYAAYVGGYLGLSGMLPFQLRRWGWPAHAADTAVALSTVSFIAGALLWGRITDRRGGRWPMFVLCMAAAAACTMSIPLLAFQGPNLFASLATAAMGLCGGGMAVFFALLITDPRIGADTAAFSIGFATTASYAGGFLLPFVIAPLTESNPALAVSICAAAFGCAGLLVPRPATTLEPRSADPPEKK